MDKAEAIKILKDFHDESAIFSVRTALETLHPELKESEDEKIRKELIFYLGDMPEDTELRNGVTNRDVLVWLEKQDNATIKWNKNTKDNKPPFNHSVLMLTKYGISEGEWRGGNQWLQYRWSSIVRDSDVIGWMELSVLEKQGEQNHIEQNLEMVEALRTEYEKGRADAFAQMQKGWSEEDEKMLNSIIEDFGDGKTSNMLQEYWLKSIKERIGE